MKGRTSVLRLQDVADAAGVSIATASRSLSGSPGVSEEVAERVREIATSLGYVANVHARSLAGGPSRTVGLLVHEIGDSYFSEIASGVLAVASAQGLTVQIGHTGRDPGQELAQLRVLIANKTGAIIVAGSGFVDAAVEAGAKAELEQFQRSGGRVAAIGRHHLGVDAVLPDNVAGAQLVAQHLLDLGHRKIAVAAGSSSLTTVADRLRGVEQAFSAAGLSLGADVPVLEAAFTRVGGKVAAKAILAGHRDVTAVLAVNDDMAIGVLSTLRKAGVSVPGDVSVTGFDDVAVAGDLAPALTTVRLPMTEMGEMAMLMALKQPGSRLRRRSVGAELVVRESTRKLR